MIVTDLAPAGTTAAIIVLAVLGVTIFIVAPIVRYLKTARP